MRGSTRFIASIAAGGLVAGGAVALSHTASPAKTTKTAVSSTVGAASNAAMQRLVDESDQLHAAVDAAQAQLAQLSAVPTTAAGTVDKAAFLAQAQQLAAAKAALAAAEQQLAADDVLLANLRTASGHGATTTSKTAPVVTTRVSTAPALAPVAQPTRPPVVAPVQNPTPTYRPPSPTPTSKPSSTRTATRTPTPSPTGTRSPQPTPTNGGGDA
jgi:hypothetical protein